MTSKNLPSFFRGFIVSCVVFLASLTSHAQLTFTGVNTPGSVRDIQLTVGAATTNFSMTISGSATAFSHLALKAGGPPGPGDFDFAAVADGQGNAIRLERPDVKTTNYILRVETPTNSQTHSYTVTVTGNEAGLRTAAKPATKAIVSSSQGSLAPNNWHYFRVDIPTNISGWKLSLGSTNGVYPDLYVQRDQVPTTSAFLKRSQSLTNDLIIFSGNELSPGVYLIGVYQPAAALGTNAYTLQSDLLNFTTLNWDPGTTHPGTEVYSSPNTNGGDFYFKITTFNSTVGGWRTALNVSTGEASLYLSRGSPPTMLSFQFKSERVGSDGFVLPPTSFNAGEDWYFLVHAEPGASWTLMSGEPYVANLGVVAADASSGSGDVTMGPEGFRFFKTTMPGNIAAWRLWLNGQTNNIQVRKQAIPFPTVNDLNQAAQMLVVPGYLGGGQLYFVGVPGNPGAVINVDSRQQSVTDISFQSTNAVTMTGFGYSTYRVTVPPNQIAWQVNVVASAGNPNVAVRRNLVPNEFNNDAYSEVGGLVTDSITLVPPTLSDGTFYVTVYGTNNHSFALQSGIPVVTDINFVSTTVNTDTNRVGWRFFRVADIIQQQGSLGWDLFLTNQVPGTRIALRRNAVPGIWNYRNPNQLSSGSYDYLSVADFLQRPRHQADVWYVGVYNPTNALRDFTLITRELTPELVNFDGAIGTRSSVTAGRWQYFRIDVPAGVLGWDLRLTNVTSGSPQLYLTKELLPTLDATSLAGKVFSLPVTPTNWLSGYQWSPGKDWTQRDLSPGGTVNEMGRVLTMGMGRPLDPGTYYVGVINVAADTNAMSYTLASRGIGTGQTIPVTDIPFNGGSATVNALEPRDVACFRVAVPSNTPTWKVKLTTTSGDAVLAVAKDHLPNISASNNGSVTNTATAGRKMLSIANEHFVQLPGNAETNLYGGTYYLLVASDGQVETTNRTRIGTGASSFVLQSLGAMPEIDLGLLAASDLVYNNGQLEGGETVAFRFRTTPDTLGFEMSLEDRVGNPAIVTSDVQGHFPDPGSGNGAPLDPYGNDGGIPNSVSSTQIITVANPYDEEIVMVKARAGGGDYPDASYTLRIRKLVPQPLAFDGGVAAVSDHIENWRFFQVDVPPDAIGWDIRITDVQSGSPQMVVCRDFYGIFLSTTGGFQPGIDTNWFSSERWLAGQDWTLRGSSANGLTNETGRILAMGMGRPLEPGRYYVSVKNNNAGATTMSYSIMSRGIGFGMSLPVVDLPFNGGASTNAGLAPREAAYYRTVIPAGAASWRAKLTSGTGETMLLALSNTVPNVLTGRPIGPGRAMQKTGNEHYLQFPLTGQTALGPKTNYLAVVSEGVLGTNSTGRIGTGTSSYVIESKGELPVVDMGVAGSTDLVQTGALEGGEVKGYQFVVPSGMSSLEVRLENTTGNPVVVVRIGPELPDPGIGSSVSGTGYVNPDMSCNEGGHTFSIGQGNANTSLVTMANPISGTYTVMVKARPVNNLFTNATYTLRVRALDVTIVDFDGGFSVVTNQAAGSWRYFLVDVPDTALGWDVRLANVSSGLPKVVVRRDLLPSSMMTTPWGLPGNSTNWPTTNQWAAGPDWTRRNNSPDGTVDQSGRILAAGIGRPLEPGTYYVGVRNSLVSSNMTYTFQSRGIGDAMSIPVTDLLFDDGSVSITDLAPREAAYFRTTIPFNTPSWKVKLTATAGESMLVVLKDQVPNVDTGNPGVAGKLMQKADDEHYILLPPNGQSNVAAGTYYLAVVSEGVNPFSVSRIGTDSSSFTITSEGSVPVPHLGTVGPADLVQADTLGGGESKFYQFTGPAGFSSFEIRLEGRVGNPVMALAGTSLLPDPSIPGTGIPQDLYGNQGGYVTNNPNGTIFIVPNATNVVYTLAVKARATAPTGPFPDASYTLRVRQIPIPQLNFTSEQNTNGFSNTAIGQLLHNESAFYKVVVPTNVNGKTVIGWELNLAQSSGLASVRARREALPSDAVTGMPFATASAILAPSFLTNGTWYVEVRGSNSTSFTLTSKALALQRPAWQMPGDGEPVTTPGLVAPDFGDTDVDTNGVASTVGEGTDLQQGYYHYYAVNVPTNNAGLMRVQLKAISGYPDLYLRTNMVPTASHTAAGVAGAPLADRTATGTTTDYPNWVPLDGKTETRLKPGLWYVAVRAVGNANARYHLRFSTGNIQDLPADGGSFTSQSVVSNDWRYYRVQIPQDSPQVNWSVTFSQQSGDVVLYLRDTVPPGNGASTLEFKDWTTDGKHIASYTSYDAPGTYTFAIPPIRPGAVYYLGFRARSDANFSVSSAVGGATVPVIPSIEFYGGTATNVIPPLSQVLYRIFAPADASRWKHSAIHSNQVQLTIANGTLPTASVFAWRSSVANSSLSQALGQPAGTWPWVPNVN